MARRNRRKKSAGFVFPLPVAALLMATVALLLMYVWLDARGQALGARIRVLERQKAEIARRYDHEIWKWEAMKSPASIERALRQHSMDMVWPVEGNLVRIQNQRADETSLAAGRQVVQVSRLVRSELHD